MTIDCVAYELEVYVYGASNAVLYCMEYFTAASRGLRCCCTPLVFYCYSKRLNLVQDLGLSSV